MEKEILNKVQEKLTIKELAALSFNRTLDATPVEKGSIVDAVPHYTYRMPDTAFLSLVDGLIDACAWWGVEHWRTMFQYSALFIRDIQHQHKDEWEQSEEMLEARHKVEAILLSQEEALHLFMDKYKLDERVVRAATQSQPFKGFHPHYVKSDPEHVNIIFELLCTVVEKKEEGNATHKLITLHNNMLNTLSLPELYPDL